MTITTVNIERKRGDTCAEVYVFRKNGVLADLSQWGGFTLTVSSEKKPIDATSQVFQAIGFFGTDGTDGEVGFVPPGDTPAGTYYYDIQGIDPAAKKCTVVEGRWKLTQDINKD